MSRKIVFQLLCLLKRKIQLYTVWIQIPKHIPETAHQKWLSVTFPFTECYKDAHVISYNHILNTRSKPFKAGVVLYTNHDVYESITSEEVKCQQRLTASDFLLILSFLFILDPTRQKSKRKSHFIFWSRTWTWWPFLPGDSRLEGPGVG